LHLAFNVYWLWILGTVIERIYGHTKTMLLIVLFAVGSSSLDFALARGGGGLSGVGYGLFGLLWILSMRDDRFSDAINQEP
jgi:membrane associated rhomboid family serine protease